MKLYLIAIIAIAIFALQPAITQERPPHFKGKESPTLADAFTNLKEANAELAEIVKKDNINDAEMLQVHMLSYTVENALERIAKEQAQIAELLEQVHVASETADAATVLTKGREFLKRSSFLTNPPSSP